MKYSNSLFKNTREYDEDKMQNILSHYKESYRLVFPFVKDGCVVNEVLKYVSKNLMHSPAKVILMDNNPFILHLYYSIYEFHNELKDALQYIEKSFNDSNNKLSIYDLFLSYLSCNYTFLNNIHRPRLTNNSGNISIPSLDMTSNCVALNICFDKKSLLTDVMLNNVAEQRWMSNYKTATISRSGNSAFLVEGGLDVYQRMSKYDVYDKAFIEGISMFPCIILSALYITVSQIFNNTTNKHLLNVIKSYNSSKPGSNSKYNRNISKLNFNSIYDTIDELHNAMNNLCIEMYYLDLKQYFLLWKDNRMTNPNHRSTMMYIDVYDEYGEYDYDLSKIVKRLVPESTNYFSY